MNIIMKLNIVLLIMVLLSFGVSAFGIATSWWDERPLILEPGETRDVHVTLQNGAGATEDVIANVELSSGKDITQIIDEDNNYLVPAGEEVKVNLRIKVPGNANIGDKYNIGLSVKALPEKAGGPVLIASGVGTSFPVLIQYHEPVPKLEEEAKKVSQQTILPVVILIILVIIIFILYKFYYKKSGEKKRK